MTVKKKEDKNELKQEEFVKKASSLEIDHTSVKPEEKDSLQVFTLRIPKSFLRNIDEIRKKDVGNTSRNTWILEAIDTRLKAQ